jgi:malonyl CoA-acyl carrier protein transacylase
MSSMTYFLYIVDMRNTLQSQVGLEEKFRKKIKGGAHFEKVFAFLKVCLKLMLHGMIFNDDLVKQPVVVRIVVENCFV